MGVASAGKDIAWMSPGLIKIRAINGTIRSRISHLNLCIENSRTFYLVGNDIGVAVSVGVFVGGSGVDVSVGVFVDVGEGGISVGVGVSVWVGVGVSGDVVDVAVGVVVSVVVGVIGVCEGSPGVLLGGIFVGVTLGGTGVQVVDGLGVAVAWGFGVELGTFVGALGT